MKTIDKNISNEYIINKSRFITYLIKIENINDIQTNLKELKKIHKDATHYCYAYIFDNVKRFNDDGEPSGTAGMPILNVLENNDLNYILCVVIRYFGGIKLGAGGLVRAYSKSVTKALDKIVIKNLIEGFKVTIQFNYDQNKLVDNMLKNYKIINKEFNDYISYTFLIDKENFKILENNINIKIINKEAMFI